MNYKMQKCNLQYQSITVQIFIIYISSISKYSFKKGNVNILCNSYFSEKWNQKSRHYNLLNMSTLAVYVNLQKEQNRMLTMAMNLVSKHCMLNAAVIVIIIISHSKKIFFPKVCKIRNSLINFSLLILSIYTFISS